MSFNNLEDAELKLSCLSSVETLEDFYIANSGSLSNGVILFQDKTLSTPVVDNLYVLKSNLTIFRTINGVVEILKENNE